MLGVFDSGVGGLTVLKAIRSVLPTIPITYLGDSARTPYGDRSRSVITQYTKECCSFLFDQGCTLIVLACNTASAETLRTLQQEWLPELSRDGVQRNILGVIRPLAEEAVLRTKSNCIGVVGTRSTIASETYIQELTALRSDVRVVQKACPLLVPLVEEQWHIKPETRKIIKTYLASLKSNNPDVLILGCTHYEALHSIFAEIIGKRCTVLHSPSIIAEKLTLYLKSHPQYVMAPSSNLHLFTTGDPERFTAAGSQFFGTQLSDVKNALMDHSQM